MNERLPLLAAVATLTFLACGGEGNPAGVPSSTPPPPPPSTPAPQVTAGVVYARSDTIAWSSDPNPTSLLPNVQLTLAGVSGTSSVAGAYSLQTNIAATTDFVPMTASATGFIPTWYPWRYGEPGQPITIGLYPERAVTPRPGFIKGVTFHDGGGWAVDWYNAGLTLPTTVRMHNTVAANLVAFGDMLSLTQMDVATNTVVITNETGGLGVRAHYETMVAQARANGMAFMMMLALQPRGDAIAPFNGLFDVPTTNKPFWDAFFSAYRARVLEKAAVAKDLGVEYFGVGFQMGFLTRLEASRWRSLIDDVRAVGYTGKIMYVASASLPNSYLELASAPAEFLTLFDVYGLKLTGSVTAARGETLANAQPRSRMRADLRVMLDRVNSLLAGRPYLLIQAAPSVFGAVSTRDYIEPCLSCSPIASTYTRDYQQQADMYQALAEVINERPGDNRILGLVSWGYLWHDDYARAGTFSQPNSAAFDKSANVRGKPAEAVLRWWFQRW